MRPCAPVEATQLVSDRVPEKWVLGFGSAMEKWVLRRVTQVFFSFFSQFLPDLIIFQSRVVRRARAITKYAHKFGKK